MKEVNGDESENSRVSCAGGGLGEWQESAQKQTKAKIQAPRISIGDWLMQLDLVDFHSAVVVLIFGRHCSLNSNMLQTPEMTLDLQTDDQQQPQQALDQRLGSSHYRKQQLCSQQWYDRSAIAATSESNHSSKRLQITNATTQPFDLTRYRVACAPYGGPIALLRDTTQVLMLGALDDDYDSHNNNNAADESIHSSDAHSPQLRITAANGRLLSTQRISVLTADADAACGISGSARQSRVLHMQWLNRSTARQLLVLIVDSGCVCVVDAQCRLLHTHVLTDVRAAMTSGGGTIAEIQSVHVRQSLLNSSRHDNTTAVVSRWCDSLVLRLSRAHTLFILSRLHVFDDPLSSSGAKQTSHLNGFDHNTSAAASISHDDSEQSLSSSSSPHTHRLAAVPLQLLQLQSPTCMLACVTSDAVGCEVLLGTQNGSLLVVTEDRCIDLQLGTTAAATANAAASASSLGTPKHQSLNASQQQQQQQSAAAASSSSVFDSPFCRLTVNSDCSLIALFTDSGALHVLSLDLTEHLCEFHCRAKHLQHVTNGGVNAAADEDDASLAASADSPLQHIVFVQRDAVALYWRHVLLLVDVHSGSYLQYAYSSPVDAHLLFVPELDGLRIVGSQRTEWLCRVDAASEQVFGLSTLHHASASSSRAAAGNKRSILDHEQTLAQRLFDAQEAYQHGGNGSTVSAELIHYLSTSDEETGSTTNAESTPDDITVTAASVQAELEQAIDVCMRASHCEFDPAMQASLLRAASTGRLHLQSSVVAARLAREYVETQRTLRVLNTLRLDASLGYMLTYAQYQALGVQRHRALLARLCDMNAHLVAQRALALLQPPIAATHSLASASSSHQRMQVYILMDWARKRIEHSATVGVQRQSNGLVTHNHSLAESNQQRVAVHLIQMLHEECCRSPFVRYASLAECACDSGGQRVIALRLLSHEMSAHASVPLLLRLGEHRLALQCACTSNDAELVLHTVLHLFALYCGSTSDSKGIVSPQLESATTASMLRPLFVLLADTHMARNAFLAHCQQQRLLHTLKLYYYFCEQPAAAAHMCMILALAECHSPTQITRCIQELLQCIDLYARQSQITASASSTSSSTVAAQQQELLAMSQFERQSCMDQLKLLQFIQQDMSTSLVEDSNFSSSIGQTSAAQVLQYLLTRNEKKRAARLVQLLSLSDRLVQHCTIRALVGSDAPSGVDEQTATTAAVSLPDWYGLQQYAASISNSGKREPACGWNAFLDVCLARHAPDAEALHYARFVTDPHRRMEWLCTLKAWDEAVQTAAQHKDYEAIRVIRHNCKQPQTQRLCDDLLDKFAQR